MRVPVITLCVCALTTAAAHAQQSNPAARPAPADWERIVAAEDARARTPEQLQTLLAGVRSRTPETRRISLRALGRLERFSLADTIATFLNDPSASVRAQAAHALAQSARATDAPALRARVTAALAQEKDPTVIAALAESLGRLRYASAADARGAIAGILPLLNSTPLVRLGALRGLSFIARQPAARPAFDSTAHAALRRAATARPVPGSTTRRSRVLAASTLVASGGATEAALVQILGDPEPYVRREAAAATVPDTLAAIRLVRRGLGDRSGVVRLEALGVWGRRFAATHSCDTLLPSLRDSNAHVRLAAIDLLGRRCMSSGQTRPVALLDSIAASLGPAAASAWHAPAHALIGLAVRDAQRARERLPRFAAHPNFFVRTYAAVGAAIARDTATQLRLAGDTHPNVRHAAVEGLAATHRHAADSVYLAQLSQDDSQLLMAAAAALDSTSRSDVAPALLDALDRLTAQRRENSRDARVALLQVTGRLAGESLAGRVQPYLQDFDSAVAAIAANVLTVWTKTPHAADPKPLPLVPTPSFTEAAALERARVTMVMESGDTIELRLLPFDAPANAARFATLSREGYFNGLTLHRIAPNFVVQGGSPNANEYRGAPEFSRDEVGGQHWRGTLGISTRGRDTGDAQIFINLIDNTRLDHDYTVFAVVTRGMEAVDRFLEGEKIRVMRIF
jgi:cyclophilin family peptidyl-prolyl cis-trans isomerase/HEAT repeat protein